MRGDYGMERSLIQVKKCRGPRTVPWGTPDITPDDSEGLPSTTTTIQKMLHPI